MSKSVVDVELGGYDAALGFYDKNTTPHLIILETNSTGDKLLSEIEGLAEVCDAGTSLLLLGTQNDIQMYRELTRRGVSDYLITPIDPRQILETVLSIFVDPEAPDLARTLAFFGVRGGCGSSTIAHNVASILSEEMDEDVVLIDMDIAFGTAALAFNLEASQGVHTALADPERLDEVLLERFLLPYGDNLKILGSPATLEFEGSIRIESLDRLLDLTRRRASYVIVDLPHIWVPWSRQVLYDADQAVLTGPADLAGLRDMKNLYERLDKSRGTTAPTYLALNGRTMEFNGRGRCVSGC